VSNMDVRISKEVQFDAGHRVPNHTSKCKNPHGHRYRLIAHCEGRIIDDPNHPEDGMLVDFGRLKALLNEFHDIFDHGFIIGPNDLVLAVAFAAASRQMEGEPFKVIDFPYVPTAENIARWVYDELHVMVADTFGESLWLSQVEVWETPTSQAVYPV
jgi:6-pyruvoyltetrahydropterin/6-carboxytetrahydropterin synthase